MPGQNRQKLNIYDPGDTYGTSNLFFYRLSICSIQIRFLEIWKMRRVGDPCLKIGRIELQIYRIAFLAKSTILQSYTRKPQRGFWKTPSSALK